MFTDKSSSGRENAVDVNFTVVIEDVRAVRRLHRLVGLRQEIDDRQPPVGEADPGFFVNPCPLVRPR